MLSEFQKYLDLFYLNISGLWILSLRDTREMLLKDLQASTLATSLSDEKDIEVDMYNLAHKLPTAPFKSEDEVNKFIRWEAQLVIIGSYEWLKESQYWKQGSLCTQPDIVKMFKHIRDAATHNNIFVFQDKRFLPLTWRTKTLDISWENKQLFSDWMSLGDIEYFFEDVSKEVK